MKAIIDQYTELVRAGKLTRQRAYQLRRVASGKCAKCGMPKVTGQNCLKHAVYERERQRKKKGSIEERESKLRKLEREFVPPPIEDPLPVT